MRRSDIVISLLLVVLIPAAVILLSFNVTFRIPVTYGFYLTDTNAASRISYEVEDDDLTNEVVSYLSNPTDHEFQIYQKVGKYEDEVFSERDQEAMANAKDFLMKTGVAAVVAFILVLGLFLYAVRKMVGDKDNFRFFTRLTAGAFVVMVALQDILAFWKPVRLWFYTKAFGVWLPEDSVLNILFSQGFAKSYCIVSSVICAIFFVLYLYICYRRYRPHGRIFY